jgi:hypothetical protein
VDRHPRLLLLTNLILWLMVTTSVADQQCRNVRVGNIKRIFAIAPSPVSADVMFYGSAEEMEGEIVTGKLFRLPVGGAENDLVQVNVPDASNPPAPVWQPDGRSAYFETDQGVYQLSSSGGPPQLLWHGPSEGLAISSDGLLLAFWHMGKGSNTLVLYDLKKKSEARTWRVPDRFESDKSGWDLAFANDGHAVYARTYDQASRTPLKRFDINSGKVTVVSPDSYSVAQGKEAVYFIAISANVRSLHKIATTGRSILVAKDFGYDSLSRGGNPRWLISQDYRSKEIIILDTATDAIKPIGKHESAAVLSDGKLIMVSGANIMVGDPSCPIVASLH